MRRRCDSCGQAYRRRNLTEYWVRQNPGKRRGWGKRQGRVCTWCQGAAVSQRLWSLSQIRTLQRLIGGKRAAHG